MTNNNRRFSVDEVKAAASGYWPHIITTIAPQTAEAVSRGITHGPCPFCGGKDRFRMMDTFDHDGAAICNQCGPDESNKVFTDGFALLEKATGKPFPELLSEVATLAGLGPEGSAPPPPAARARADDEAERKRKEQRLRSVWREGVLDDGTISNYFRGRGLSGEVPKALLLHKNLKYFEGTECIGRFPAILAPLMKSDGSEGVTIHRTYLAPGGAGKAEVPHAKKWMPAPTKSKGAAIRLCPAAESLAVAEGIENALAVNEATGLPVWAAGTADRLGDMILPGEVKRVEVWADNDKEKTGQKAAENLAERLLKEGRQVKVIIPPKAGEDWLDIFVAKGPEELRKAQKAAKRKRPQIVVTGRFLREITDDSIDALQKANDPPALFERSGELVRVYPHQNEAEVMSVPALKGMLDRTADFMKVRYVDGDEVLSPARPPSDLAPDIMALPRLPFPTLRTITNVPTVTKDGRLLTQEGFDLESGTLLRLRGLGRLDMAMPLENAKELLLVELLGDFPFAEAEAGPAHVLSTLLQPFVRPLIDGPTPATFTDAPTRGTGKTLLSEIMILIPTGAAAPVMSLVGNEEEIDKRITSLLLSATSHVLIDNATTINSTSLAAVLTSEVWRGRRLGKSEMIDVPNLATWLITGNNVELSDEHVRRVIPIRLDAQVERPETRTDFRHENLHRWARDHRPELVSACLAFVTNWLEKGMPRSNKRLGRYESWAEVMGGILEAAEIPGFLEGRERLYAQADQASNDWAAFCARWNETYPEQEVTAGALVELAKEHDLLIDVWAGARGRQGPAQRMGRELKQMRDRVFGDYRIVYTGVSRRTKNATYTIHALRNVDETPANTRGRGETPAKRNPITMGKNEPTRLYGGVRGCSLGTQYLQGPTAIDEAATASDCENDEPF